MSASQSEDLTILAAILGVGIAAAIVDTLGRPLWIPNWLIAIVFSTACVAAYDWSLGQRGLLWQATVLFVIIGLPMMLIAYGLARVVIRYFGKVMW
jgi:hypothetical protein